MTNPAPLLIGKLSRINLWHFVWIAVASSVFLSIVLSFLIHGRLTWDYPFAAACISATVAAAILFIIKQARLEQQRVTEAFRESEARFRAIFEETDIGMGMASLDGRVLRTNAAFQRMLGYTEDELSRMHITDFTHPEDVPTTLVRARELFAGRSDHYQSEKRYIRKDGQVVWVHLTASLVRDTIGKPSFGIGMVKDISQRKRAEDGLRTKTEQLQVISEAMTQFLENDNWQEASSRLLHGALSQTESEYGFIGVVAEGPTLRILAYEGLIWHATENREFYDQAIRGYQGKGYLEFTNFNNLFGTVITTGTAVISNEPGRDPRSGGLPPGHPPLHHFMGVPILRGTSVVGMIGVANRQGGYAEAEQAKIEILTQAVGVLYDSYVRQERETNLEGQLRQSQKMEAIGRLAGGLAHDFNNLLMVIKGYSGLTLESCSTDELLRGSVKQIAQAADSAAALVRQFLAFSRKQVLVPKVIHLNTVITGMSAMLQPLLGEDIDLATDLDETIGHVKADPSQLEQVIMNLAVNARDAMPEGGKLTIETRNRDITETSRHGQIVRLGRYVALTVSDTGSGMDQETQARIFEPFFTTKELGKGTGLGLSTVYGIVKQSGGYVFCYSEQGRGSNFRVYLPRVDEVAETVALRSVEHVPVTGTEAILLVEDEPNVRALIRETLTRRGYTVLEARHGFEALLVANRESSPIHLLLTDVIMPQMSGRELAAQLTESRPDLKVLYMSGYTDVAVVHHGVLDPGTAFLQKPFDADVLLRTVREVLDTSRTKP